MVAHCALRQRQKMAVSTIGFACHHDAMIQNYLIEIDGKVNLDHCEAFPLQDGGGRGILLMDLLAGEKIIGCAYTSYRSGWMSPGDRKRVIDGRTCQSDVRNPAPNHPNRVEAGSQRYKAFG